MNKQEVESSLPFKAVKKILKKNYPFIIRLVVPDDVEKYSSLIFLDIYIDIFKLMEIMPKYELDNFYKKHYLNNSDSNIWGASSFAAFFNGGPIQERIDYFKPLIDDILKILHSVARSTAIPQELRLANDRVFDISNFYIDKDALKSGLPSQP
jgi:hypothetical protein